MSWADLPKHERDQLAQRLTERQLLVYILRLGGASWAETSLTAGLQIRTCRGHEHAAHITHRQIRQEAA